MIMDTQEKLASAERAIFNHNRACQDRCGRGDNEAKGCKYRPYFLNNGRRCPDCPVYEKIAYPEGSEKYPEGPDDTIGEE